MKQQVLRGTCRHCRQPVVFTYLPHMPNAESGDRRQFIRYMIWYHKGRELGDELHCRGVTDPEYPNRVFRAASREYCVEHTNPGGYGSGICNRPVKDHDLFMCGIHARRVHKRKEDDAKWKQKHEISDYVFTNTLALQHKIKEGWGLETKTDYSYQNHEWTGKITVNPAELLDLLEEMQMSMVAMDPGEPDEQDMEFEDFG